MNYYRNGQKAKKEKWTTSLILTSTHCEDASWLNREMDSIVEFREEAQ